MNLKSCFKLINMIVLVSLIQLIYTIYNICKVQDSNPDHKKKSINMIGRVSCILWLFWKCIYYDNVFILIK